MLLARGGGVGVETLNASVAVAVRKLAMPREEVREAPGGIRALCPSPVPLSVRTHEAAPRIVGQYGDRTYDPLAIAASSARKA